MASWKKVIVEGAAASLASLTLTTDLAVAQGGTGASTAADARGNLGLAIGSDVQAYDANLADIAGLSASPGDGEVLIGNGSAFVLESGATLRTSLGLGTAATTAASAYATSTQGATADAALPEADVDADIKTLSLPANTTISAFGKTLIDDAAASNARTTLGLGTAAVLNTAAIADSGTGLATADQIHTFVTGFGYTTNTGDVTLNGTQTLTNKTIAISQVTELSNLTATEGAQLENIGSTTISAAQWGYLGAATGAITNTDTNVDVGTLETRLAQIDTATTIGNGVTMTAGGDFVVTGDLTVSGDTITANVTNLNITDKFINLNDGGAAADAGLVFEGQGASLGWDESASRLGFDFSGATEGQSAIASDAFVAMVVTGSNASYQYNGNIKIESSDIYIYVE